MSTKPKEAGKGYIKLSYYLLPVVGVVNCVLPFALKLVANQTLKRTKGYRGKVKSIRLSIPGNKLTVEGLCVEEMDRGKVKSSVNLNTFALRLSRAGLRKGFIEANVTISDPRIVYKQKASSKKSASANGLPAKPSDRAAVIIRSAEISNGQVEFFDNESTPPVQIAMTNIELQGKNLSNYPNAGEQLPAHIKIKSRILEGTLSANVKADVSQQQPSFDLNAEVKNMNLVMMNSFFKAYGKFDVNDGRLSLFTEVAAKDGNFTGYVKPEIVDLDVLGPEDYHKNFGRMTWQAIVGGVTSLITNPKQDQLATKVPLSGSFSHPKPNIWVAVGESLYNAFIEALRPSIDYEINLNSVKK